MKLIDSRPDPLRGTAAYEYSAFGDTVRSTGTFAASNVFRFSTKYTDQETQLLYYGRRFYNPALGRWLNRDPAEERGGDNLTSFCFNNPVNLIDSLGEYATVVQIGNNIEVTIPLYFEKGTDQKVIDQAIAGIKQGWNGTFGDVSFTTNVVIMNEAPSAKNPGNQVLMIYDKDGTNSYIDIGSTNGSLTMYYSSSTEEVWAHEAGHAFGLRDKYMAQWLNLSSGEYEFKDAYWRPTADEKMNWKATGVGQEMLGWERSPMGPNRYGTKVTEKDIELFLAELGKNHRVWIQTDTGLRRASAIPKDPRGMIDFNRKMESLKNMATRLNGIAPVIPPSALQDER